MCADFEIEDLARDHALRGRCMIGIRKGARLTP